MVAPLCRPFTDIFGADEQHDVSPSTSHDWPCHVTLSSLHYLQLFQEEVTTFIQ